MPDTKSPEQLLEEAWVSIDASDEPLDVRLATFVDRARELAPRLMTAYDSFVDRITRSGAGEGVPGVGDRMPDFVLPDQNGRLVSLRDLIAAGPLIVSFNRGQWCKFCRMEVRSLAVAHDDLVHAGAQIVSIVPDTGDYTAKLIESNELPFAVLTDVDLGYALSLGIAVWVGEDIKSLYENKMGIHLAHRHGNDFWLLPIPVTMIVGTDGHIIARFVDPDFRRRMTIDAMRVALRSAGTRC